MTNDEAIIAHFNIINKSIPVPELFTNDQITQCKRDLISKTAESFSRDYKALRKHLKNHKGGILIGKW